MFEAHQKRSFIKHFTSFETANQINQVNTNCKLNESTECRPFGEVTLKRHTAKTCRRRNRTCTTNQFHVEFRTSNATTKVIPTTLNCNCRQSQRKTYQSTHTSNDDNHNCINNRINNKNSSINSQSDWYTELASNCLRNGFELHVNHLDQCSKHPSFVQSKPAQASFLRLPSSLFRSPSLPSSSPTTSKRSPLPSPSPSANESCDSAVSLVADLVACSSSQTITVDFSSHFDKTHCSLYSVNCDQIRENQCHPHQLPNDEINQICCKKQLTQTYNPSQAKEISIDATNITLPITIDTTPIARQSTATKQFNVLNVENNMNSVAIDAANNLQQNLQLSCQAIQYNNNQNNNLTFHREYQASNSSSGEQEPLIIGHNNNNYQQQQHWVDNSNLNPISLTDQRHIERNHKGIETRPTLSTAIIENSSNVDTVNDLIVAFNSSFDVSEANQHKLPQIILSDFSSDQATPPTTPLFFTVQTSARTLPEHPSQLPEFQIYRNNTTI